MELLEKIKSLAKKQHAEIVAIRRHLHAHPELSFQEKNTSDYIAKKLLEIGIPLQRGIAGTGLVGIIEGKNPKKKNLALRADMDALPIQETNKTGYESQNPGVMHACGHDAHSSSLLGAAKILFETRDDWEGSVKLIFQPGEEKLPGGASMMIKEGVLENPKPSHILAQHVTNLFPAGKVGFRSGLYMASADELYLSVKGKGGHAALPDNYINPLLIASAILLELNAYFMDKNSKKIPNIPTVLAFGKIMGMGATNVIPEQVQLEGTLRTMNEVWRKEAHEILQKIVKQTAERMGGTAELKILVGYPFLTNEEKLTERSRSAAEQYLGKENVLDLDIWMAAEDFAYYSQEMPACFYRLGIRNDERGIVSSVHTSTFDIDEDSLMTGSGLMAWLAVSELSR